MQYVTERLINQMLMALGGIPLDAPVRGKDDQEDATIGDLMPAPGPSPEEQVVESRERERLSRLLDEALTPREAAVLRARFRDGLMLREIGERWGICRERVRQIERDALAKLRRRLLAEEARHGLRGAAC